MSERGDKMSRKKFALALTNFIFACFLTITVTVAWFVIMTQSKVDMPSLKIQTPIIDYFEISF